MKKQKKSLKNLNIDTSWTLFLDRDGVINVKIEGDYVKNWDQLEFIPEFLNCIRGLSEIFGRIIITTNQRCVGRKIISEKELNHIHSKMLEVINRNGKLIDELYYCPHKIEDDCDCRKPKTGMALMAKSDFSDIDFSKSIMLGDSESDIEFGEKCGMVTVLISKTNDTDTGADYIYTNAYSFYEALGRGDCSS